MRSNSAGVADHHVAAGEAEGVQAAQRLGVGVEALGVRPLRDEVARRGPSRALAQLAGRRAAVVDHDRAARVEVARRPRHRPARAPAGFASAEW